MSKKRKMSKKQSQRWHFKWALYDRYGIYCNRELYYKLLDLARDGELLVKQSNTRQLKKMFVSNSLLDHEKTHPKPFFSDNGVTVYVIYDKSRRELITALPWYNSDLELIRDYEENHKYER